LTRRYLFLSSWFLFLSSFPIDLLVSNFIVNSACVSFYKFQIFHDVRKFDISLFNFFPVQRSFVCMILDSLLLGIMSYHVQHFQLVKFFSFSFLF
jgi:hypothetical protein